MPFSRVRVRGFTLIELLVVVAIIALLIGILLPALGQVRGSARTAKCLSQMKTLGQFTAVYAHESRDAMPRSQHSAFPNRVAPWGYAFFEYVTGEAYTQGESAWDRVLNGPYRCPHDRRVDRWSYGYNVYFELTPDETHGPTWTRLAQVPTPSVTVLFGELSPSASADHAMAHFWAQFSAPPEIDPHRHATGTGVVHADGHAVSRPFSVFFDRSVRVDQYNPATAR